MLHVELQNRVTIIIGKGVRIREGKRVSEGLFSEFQADNLIAIKIRLS